MYNLFSLFSCFFFKTNKYIEDCRTRYNGDADHHQRRNRLTFPARLLCGDCFEVRLDEVSRDDGPFDICSFQFAMHYSWSTEARARRALENVSSLIHPGGTFIGIMPNANYILLCIYYRVSIVPIARFNEFEEMQETAP
ncbi:hypothetical protein MKX03_001873 [Papaver bracteatum]|nr:hypothetical protein MKX03_001873 [Papaver bracteatum]